MKTMASVQWKWAFREAACDWAQNYARALAHMRWRRERGTCFPSTLAIIGLNK